MYCCSKSSSINFGTSLKFMIKFITWLCNNFVDIIYPWLFTRWLYYSDRYYDDLSFIRWDRFGIPSWKLIQRYNDAIMISSTRYHLSIRGGLLLTSLLLTDHCVVDRFVKHTILLYLLFAINEWHIVKLKMRSEPRIPHAKRRLETYMMCIA